MPMTKKEYEQMKQELRRDYEEKLAALEKLWSVFGRAKSTPVSSNGSSASAKPWNA